VLRILGVNNNSESLVRVKGHAARLGLDVSHLTQAARPAVPADVRDLAPRPELVRTAAASIATSWFLLRGLATAFPTEPQEYDLLVTFPEGIQRVQVKSTTFRVRNGRWAVGVGQRPYVMDKSASKAPYDPETLDYFFIVTGDGGLYLVPSRALAGRTKIYIDSYPEYRVGDVSSLLTWAD
jgi:hypothetical protein